MTAQPTAATALVAYLAGLAAAFGWRTVVHRRATGNSGYRGAAVQIQVRRVEEPYLAAAHGPAYRHYAAHAGRFLPRVGRLTPPRTPADTT